jgi:hypothetical protein
MGFPMTKADLRKIKSGEKDYALIQVSIGSPRRHDEVNFSEATFQNGVPTFVRDGESLSVTVTKVTNQAGMCRIEWDAVAPPP